MRGLGTAILAATVLGAGCAGDPTREWMKVNQKYTVEEFRRDHETCRRAAQGYDTCMRDSGWVDVSRPAEKPMSDIPSPTRDFTGTPRR